MKLSKALKEKKRMAANIARLKSTIQKKNSFLVGSLDQERYNCNELMEELKTAIEELITLKTVINKANLGIQVTMYELSEAKSMLSFITGINTKEGEISSNYNDRIEKFNVWVNEIEKEAMRAKYQDFADELQEKIDTFNYTTNI